MTELNRDVISHLFSYIDDYSTIKNTALANRHFHSAIYHSVKKIGGNWNYVPFWLASRMINLEEGYFKIRDASDFTKLLKNRNKLKKIRIMIRSFDEGPPALLFKELIDAYAKCIPIDVNIDLKISYYYFKNLNDLTPSRAILREFPRKRPVLGVPVQKQTVPLLLIPTRTPS